LGLPAWVRAPLLLAFALQPLATPAPTPRHPRATPHRPRRPSPPLARCCSSSSPLSRSRCATRPTAW
jgi:hypothetical protein